jgi:hypothetical protein
MNYSIEVFFSLFSSYNKRIDVFIYGEWKSLSKAMFNRLPSCEFRAVDSEWIKNKDSITKKDKSQ